MKSIEITKEDLYPLLYFIVEMYQAETSHRQGTSSKSDFIGGFIDRWINKLPENLIFNKLILLNKILNGIWVTYKCKLPDVFLLSHPLGSILGNAVYSNFLCVFQNVTVNTGMKIGEYNPPVLGKGVVLATGAAIIGNSVIGDKVTISDTMIYKKNIPSNSSVFRDDEGKLIIKKRKEENYYGQQFFFEKI